MWVLDPQTIRGVWAGLPALACCLPPPLFPAVRVRLEEERANMALPPALPKDLVSPLRPPPRAHPGLSSLSLLLRRQTLGSGSWSCWNVAPIRAWASLALLPPPAPRAWLGLAGCPSAQSWLTETQKNVWNLLRGEPPALRPSLVAASMSIAALRGEWPGGCLGVAGPGAHHESLGTRRPFEARECGDFNSQPPPELTLPPFPDALPLPGLRGPQSIPKASVASPICL